jgi:tetratricopeptide (TPR) repeat protein
MWKWLSFLRSRSDPESRPQTDAEPVEELLLQLSGPSIVTRADGSRRARADARLVHMPAAGRNVHSKQFALEAPLGAIEADDLRWYLEDYAVWPSPLLGKRARDVEGLLENWGRLLHEAALPSAAVAKVLKSWATVGTSRLSRRFSIEVDSSPEAAMPYEAVHAMREAGTLLLGLPWELMHDGRSFLFQGTKPVRVRRRIPTEHAVPAPLLATPIRVLVVSPRPDDQGYIDHRACAGPMVETMEALAGQVELRLLAPPTLNALRGELDRARRLGQPYHVLHFDGHGAYTRAFGGGLCFESNSEGKLARGPRSHALVFTPQLGALLRDHGIPLVFLDACRSAQSESARESVASALLKIGIRAVVAMSHNVLVETSRRFVEAFYRALSGGERIGSAMLAAQRELKDSPVRGRVFGQGEFTLQDWFVPVLYQDRDDPQLFRQTPATQTVEDWRSELAKRLGELPAPPGQDFVGRSHELLTLERLLAVERYAVLRGQGGEGKTALATEFARWRVRARQVSRAAFVSVESHGHVQAVLDAIGRQLVGKNYSVATYAGLEAAIEPVARELGEQSTLLVIDNLESVLAPPFIGADADRDDPLAADARERASEILALAAQLIVCGETRIVFTSREALPPPFDGEVQRIELNRLTAEDAVQLVERTLGLDAAGQGRAAEAQREEIESLVEAVHGHARTLSLLAPALRERGPAATEADLVSLMAEMERRFPGQREQSLLASVELSLRRLTPQMRERAKVLGVFHGAVHLGVLQAMTGWEEAEVQALGAALVATGLATSEGHGHLSLDPALCPYLGVGWDSAERKALTGWWAGAMVRYALFLAEQRQKNTEMAATLTLMDLTNFMGLLEQVEAIGDADATIRMATVLFELVQFLNRPRSLARIAHLRDTAERALGEETLGHAQFEAERTRINQLIEDGRVGDGLVAAQRLYGQALALSDSTYEHVDYDQAMACFLLGRALRSVGQPDAALPQLQEAQRRFEASEARSPGGGAAGMAAMAAADQGTCLLFLGRLEDAAQVYEQAIALGEERNEKRTIAVNLAQLGTVRLHQRRLREALDTYTQALDRFEALGELRHVASTWHQIGMIQHEAGDIDVAEDTYRRALEINVQLDNVAGQAATLSQLGILYGDDRPEDAVIHYHQAAERYAALHDVDHEGRVRHRLADTLRRLGRVAEARREMKCAIECKRNLGHAARPWTAWAALADIERDDGRETDARSAYGHARNAYLVYRREGGEARPGASFRYSRSEGEPWTPDRPLIAEIGRLLLAGDATNANALLELIAGAPEQPPRLAPLVAGLRALVAGVRDPSIADDPSLEYDDAAELLLLLESLKAAGR